MQTLQKVHFRGKVYYLLLFHFPSLKRIRNTPSLKSNEMMRNVPISAVLVT